MGRFPLTERPRFVISTPRSAGDIAEDGLIQQRWIDAHLPELLGDITATEVNQLEGDHFEVRHGRRGRPDITFAATRVATLTADGWEWTSASVLEAADVFGIPALRGTQPEEPDFAAAARTLHGGGPVLRVGGDVLVAHVPVPPGNPLLTAAGVSERAIGGYQARTGDRSQVVTREGVLYDLQAGMLLDDIRSDSLFLSAEHQLLFESLIPPQPGVLQGGAATFQTPRGPLVARAVVVATVSADTWTWNPQLAVRTQLGTAQQLPALCTPSLPVDLARQWNLERVLKPILNIWTHAFIPLSEDSYAVTLLQHPAFQLPAPTPQVVSRVIDTEVPEELSRERALGFYCAARGLQRSDVEAS